MSALYLALSVNKEWVGSSWIRVRMKQISTWSITDVGVDREVYVWGGGLYEWTGKWRRESSMASEENQKVGDAFKTDKQKKKEKKRK